LNEWHKYICEIITVNMLFISFDICAKLRARSSQLKSNYDDIVFFFLLVMEDIK